MSREKDYYHTIGERNLHELLLAQQETNRLLEESVNLLDAVNSKLNVLLQLGK